MDLEFSVVIVTKNHRLSGFLYGQGRIIYVSGSCPQNTSSCYFLEIIKLLYFGGQWRRQDCVTICSHSGPGWRVITRHVCDIRARMASAETRITPSSPMTRDELRSLS